MRGDCNVVALTFASWNLIGAFLRQIDSLRQPLERWH